MRISLKTTTGKLLASAGLVAAAAAVAGMGTYGGFTSSTSASQSVTAGTVKLTLSSGSSSNVTVPVTGLIPGDKVERLLTVANTGTESMGSITLGTAPTPGTAVTALTTDAVNGLQLGIESCSAQWTGSAAPYTCAGTRTTVLAGGPIVAANRTLSGLASLNPGKSDYLKITGTLPTTAGDSFQGLASSIDVTFTGTQRAATVK